MKATNPRLRRNGANNQRFGIAKLVLAVVVIGFVWCIVLPHMASRQQMQDYTRWLDQRGIDPSAMFYTELPAMEPILNRLERPRRRE